MWKGKKMKSSSSKKSGLRVEAVQCWNMLEHVGMKGRQLIFIMDALVPPFSHNNIIVFLAIGEGLTVDLTTG